MKEIKQQEMLKNLKLVLFILDSPTPNAEQQSCNHPRFGRVKTLFGTDLQKVLYSVEGGGGGKNLTLLSGMSWYRPYWEVPPLGIWGSQEEKATCNSLLSNCLCE